jgi:hypothetical protein
VTTAPTPLVTIPRRGEQFPDLTGRTPAGDRLSTRDFYMRRNLAVLVLADDERGAAWLGAALDIRAAAHVEAGEIVIVAPPGMATGAAPTIVDAHGQLARGLGLSASDLPAVFIIDRYRTIFASNRGELSLPELTPDDVPSWLEFVACRCS